MCVCVSEWREGWFGIDGGGQKSLLLAHSTCQSIFFLPVPQAILYAQMMRVCLCSLLLPLGEGGRGREREGDPNQSSPPSPPPPPGPIRSGLSLTHTHIHTRQTSHCYVNTAALWAREEGGGEEGSFSPSLSAQLGRRRTGGGGLPPRQLCHQVRDMKGGREGGRDDGCWTGERPTQAGGEGRERGGRREEKRREETED